ncbi:hypothetical protein MMC29_003592 [Sticta canariensis]|nr:hypothetical protein [Sticta canariensis]
MKRFIAQGLSTSRSDCITIRCRTALKRWERRGTAGVSATDKFIAAGSTRTDKPEQIEIAYHGSVDGSVRKTFHSVKIGHAEHDCVQHDCVQHDCVQHDGADEEATRHLRNTEVNFSSSPGNWAQGKPEESTCGPGLRERYNGKRSSVVSATLALNKRARSFAGQQSKPLTASILQPPACPGNVARLKQALRSAVTAFAPNQVCRLGVKLGDFLTEVVVAFLRRDRSCLSTTSCQIGTALILNISAGPPSRNFLALKCTDYLLLFCATALLSTVQSTAYLSTSALVQVALCISAVHAQ